MKKIIGVFAVVGVTVLLSGCSLGPAKEGAVSVPTTKQEQVQEQAQQQSGPAQWASALASGKKMQCAYSLSGEKGQTMAMKMYAEKNRYRTEVQTPNGTLVSLFDGENTYMWTIGQKQGTKMNVQCMKELGNQGQPGNGQAPKSYDSPEQAIENTPDITCSESGDSVDLSVPSDVTFADQCAMMKKTIEQMKGLQNVPGNVPNMPTDIPENVKQRMGQ